METTTVAPRLKRELATFLVLTLALSSVFYVLIVRAGTLGGSSSRYVLMLMWCPGVSALITRLAFQHNVRGEGWRLGPPKYEVLAYLLPIGYASVAYVAVWLLGLGIFDATRFLANVPRFVVVGSLISLSSALGEELGWRGFLVPKLAERLSYTRTSIVSGVIWSLWHMPLIIFADYNGGTPVPYSIACFVVMVLGISFPLAWMRLRSGSVWPAALLHASHNLYIQAYFDRVTVNTGITKYLTGEFGAALAITATVTGFIFWRLRGTDSRAEVEDELAFRH